MVHVLLEEGDPSNAVLVLFVRFSCRTEDRSLRSADDISRLCAKLIYLAKLCILNLASAVETSKDCRVDNIKRLLPSIRVDNFNIFSELCNLKALASNAAMSANRPARIAPATANGFDVVIRGVRLHADHIGIVYRWALDTCKSILEELFLGTATSGLCLQNVHDDFANNAVGYQVMAHRDPTTDQAIRSSVLNHVLSDEKLRSKYVESYTAQSTVIYKLSEARAYLDRYDQYIENLLLIVHIGSGMPARAPELAAYRLCNGQSSARSVYYDSRSVFFHAIYNKSRSMRGKNRAIARYLDEEASHVILTDVLLVRPFVCSLALSIGVDSNVYGQHVFVKSCVQL